MLEFGWSELLLVVVVAVVAIGPKDIPALLYNLGRLMRRLQYMRFALMGRFDEFMQELELSEKAKGRRTGVNFEAPDNDPADFDEAHADEAHADDTQHDDHAPAQDHESKS